MMDKGFSESRRVICSEELRAKVMEELDKTRREERAAGFQHRDQIIFPSCVIHIDDELVFHEGKPYRVSFYTRDGVDVTTVEEVLVFYS